MTLTIPRFLVRFFNTEPIHTQIKMYVDWKAVRHPTKARLHERVLKEFFTGTHLRSVSEITPECLHAYIRKFPAEYQRRETLHTMRQFSRYWYRMGLLSKQFADRCGGVSILEIFESPVPQTMHVDQVRRVHRLRGEGLSLRQIKLRLETEDQKPYHLRQIQRWAGYELPLSTGGGVDS
jgi:hypothetical protein